MVKQGDKLTARKVAGEFWASANKFTGFFAVKVSGGYQLVRFGEWLGEDGTRYIDWKVAYASAVFPASSLRRIVTHETGSTVYYGFMPA